MALAVTELVHTLVTSPGATTSSTSSASYTSGYVYVAFVTQFRTDSVQPTVTSLSGLGVTTWNNTSGGNSDWDVDGTSRRTTTVHWGLATSSGTGALTVTYASAPGDCDICVLQCAGANTSSPINQVFDAFGTHTLGVFAEDLTMGTASPSASQFIGYVAGNVSSTTSRFELSSDTPGGDTTWTTFTVRNSTSTPTGQYFAGTGPTTNLDIGWFNGATQNTSYYLVGLEILEGVSVSATTAFVGIKGWNVEGGTPPPAYRLLVGAGVDLWNGNTSYAASTADFETLCGIPVDSMPISRDFNSGTPTSFTGVARFNQHTNKRHRIVSIKGATDTTPTQASIETFMNSIPLDGFNTWVILHHEPDNDGGTHTTTWFQSKLNTLHAAWAAVGRSDVIPSLCLTSWLERDGNSSTTSADWFPSSGIIDDFVLWLDPYDPNGIRSMQFLAEGTVDLWTAAGGDPTKWGVAETGTHRSDSAAATWVHETCDYLRSMQAVGATWFHSAVGTDGPWWIDDDRDFPNRTLTPAAWGEEMLT